jgi:hypothetical protein
LTLLGISCKNNQVNRESQSLDVMNMKKLVTTAAFLVAMATVAAPSALALTTAEIKAAKKDVVSVPAPEMPAKAANMVGKADKKDRTAMAVAVVEAVIFKNRSLASHVVSAVIKIAPETATAVTMAASRVDAAQVAAIVRAATTAAPEQSSAIRQVASAEVGPRLAASESSSAPTAETRTPRTRTLAAEPPPTGTVDSSTTPINPVSGGNGSGSFDGAVVNPAPPAEEIPYTEPRDI